MTKFKRQQVRKEFGSSAAGARRQAGLPAGGSGSGGSGARGTASGQAVANFYASVVQASGAGWVRGGSLQDAEENAAAALAAAAAASADPAAAAAAAAAASAVPPAAAGSAAAAAGEASHAGLGSAASRAEQAAAEERYEQPAGPWQRGEQQPPAAVVVVAAAGGGGVLQQQQQRQGPREGVRLGIARSNLGYQLLKKAGWTEGAGLGAQEQGIAEPVAASNQRGNLGLGFAAARQQLQGAAAAGTPGRQLPGGAAGAATSAVAATQQQQQKPKRALPEDPLDKEDKDTQVKRVRQVLQAEADQKAGRAIQRYINRAFNEATGEPTRDSNPLLRRNHKLSATNPLL